MDFRDRNFWFGMELVSEIRRLAESSLPDQSQFIVDVTLSSRKGPKKLLVIVDGDDGVNIDDCATISRRLSEALDLAGWIGDSYLLEVSTPGVDHPLKFRRQYQKHRGRKLKVVLADRTVEGVLAEIADDHIVISGATGTGKKRSEWSEEIPFSAIEKAFVLVSFK